MTSIKKQKITAFQLNTDKKKSYGNLSLILRLFFSFNSIIDKVFAIPLSGSFSGDTYMQAELSKDPS